MVPLLIALALTTVACQAPSKPQGVVEPATPQVTGPRVPAAGPLVADAGRPTVIFLGDSLTAGYGLAESEAFPALVAAKLGEEGRPIRLVNAGVSGDTSGNGLARLDWLLRQRPAVLVVGLGANDALRGQSLDQLEANLREIITRARSSGARVLLLGMLITPNLGPDYSRSFAAIYPRIAAELDVPLVPFLLAGVAGNPQLNLPDGIHPNIEGQQRVAATVFAYVEPLVVAATEDPT